MKMNKSSLLCIVVLSFSGLMVAQDSSHPRPDATLSLRDGWSLQSSGKVDAKGETLSTPAFHPKDWYEVSVPTTVVAALVKHKVYPDPFFGTNLRTFPGRHLSHRREFFQHSDAAGQPVHHPLVVPQGICAACQLQGQDASG